MAEFPSLRRIISGAERVIPAVATVVSDTLNDTSTVVSDVKSGDITGAVTTGTSDIEALIASIKADFDQKYTDLQARTDQLQAQNNELTKKLQNGGGVYVADENAPAGGAPVLHTLHLEDGSIVQNHQGIPTHFSFVDETGKDQILKVVNSFPSAA